jgi:hypothetical protein
MHGRASEGEDEKDWAPKAMQAEDAEAWVQAEEASYAQKKPNHVAYQGGGTRSPLWRTALLGSAALFVPATSGKNKGKTGQGVSAADFHQPPGNPPMRPTRAVGHVAPKGWRRC